MAFSSIMQFSLLNSLLAQQGFQIICPAENTNKIKHGRLPQILPLLILQTNPFRSAQSTSLQSPALEFELLATTQDFCELGLLGSYDAQAVYNDSDWSLQLNSAEFASRTKPSHKPPLKFFKARTTNAAKH